MQFVVRIQNKAAALLKNYFSRRRQTALFLQPEVAMCKRCSQSARWKPYLPPFVSPGVTFSLLQYEVLGVLPWVKDTLALTSTHFPMMLLLHALSFPLFWVDCCVAG